MTTMKNQTADFRERKGRPWYRRRSLIMVITLLVLPGGYATWTNVVPYTLRASVKINATPQQVWIVLTDQAAYPRWNPFIISSRGQLRAGSTATNIMHDATGNTTFTPVVEVVQPGRELRWIGRVGPGGIFDGEHTFAIQQIRPGVVMFTQQERFTGIGVPFYEGHLRADTLPQFRAMNAALARLAGR
ncbi:MAG TPA: SRPBCC domain-containing protein [Trebonia sp.]